MPNIRSEGARRIGAAMSAARTSTSAEMPATSAARTFTRHHRGEKKQRPHDRPCAHVAHVRRETAVAGQDAERCEEGNLREREQRQSARKEAPAENNKYRRAH